jgi:hypothetical protein
MIGSLEFKKGKKAKKFLALWWVCYNPPDLAETARSLMAELQSCKADNERMMKEQEKQMEINAVLLQSLSDLQRKM